MNRAARHPRTLAALAMAIGVAAGTMGARLRGAEVESAGAELFTREWVPGDSRAHGGDGLGPVFNDTSCVACHNQGGIGGAGPAAKNVQIVKPFRNDRDSNPAAAIERTAGFLGSMFRAVFGGSSAKQAVKRREPPKSESDPAASPEADPKKEVDLKKEAVRKEREELAKIHPGLRTARSVVLHRFGTGEEYMAWRQGMAGFSSFSFAPGRAGMDRKQLLQFEARFSGVTSFPRTRQGQKFAFLASERNPPALFGIGLIDRIPAEAIEATAKAKSEDFPEITGRVSRLKDGRIGRFGWKGQKASLDEFVLTACAVELGLQVPGEPQSGAPHDPDYRPPGLDLTRDECSQLTSYVASLRQPREHVPGTAHEADIVRAGKAVFTQVGCAACHSPSLGGVDGIYSDLLLHDLGPGLGDTGNYCSFAPDRTEEEELTELIPGFREGMASAVNVSFPGLSTSGVEATDAKRIGASRQEWRTPPLWGVRDSAPYLHDGRAATLEHAIAFHEGEAARSSQRYFELPAAAQLRLLTFLRSLVAP